MSFLEYWGFRLFGIAAPIRLADRTFLEETIFPWLGATQKTILFVGTRLYTAHYPRLLPQLDFHTIDIDPKNRIFGTSGKHLTGDVTRLGDYYPPAFDAVVLNGVIGWGLDDKRDVDAALRQIAGVLKPGGPLILGWNNIPRRNTFPLESLEGLGLFTPYVPSFLSTYRHETETPMLHTFDFHRRREAAP